MEDILHRALILSAFAACWLCNAETGHDAWLRYTARYSQTVPAVVTALGDSVVTGNARGELIRGIRGMTGKTPRIESGMPKEPAVVMGTLDKLPAQWNLHAALEADGYWLKTLTSGGVRYTVITAANDRGVLYGTFALLRKMSLGESISELDERQSPAAPVRWVNQWDNLDGTIERGYGGRSIFWENGQARADLSRVSDYGRLLASVGINGCSINNVNCRSANSHAGTDRGCRPHRRRVSPVGSAGCDVGRLRQPQIDGWSRYFRSA